MPVIDCPTSRFAGDLMMQRILAGPSNSSLAAHLASLGNCPHPEINDSASIATLMISAKRLMPGPAKSGLARAARIHDCEQGAPLVNG